MIVTPIAESIHDHCPQLALSKRAGTSVGLNCSCRYAMTYILTSSRAKTQSFQNYRFVARRLEYYEFFSFFLSLLLETSVTKRRIRLIHIIVLQIHNELRDHFADLDCFGRLRHTDSHLSNWP